MKKVEINLYEGIEIKLKVENGVMVAEYSEEVAQENLDIPIGETFEFNGKSYIAEMGSGCVGCDLDNCCPENLMCSPFGRDDRIGVIFKEVKEQKFKDGDFCIGENGTSTTRFIFRSNRNDGGISAYMEKGFHETVVGNGVLYQKNAKRRLLTEQEKRQFLEDIHKDGKDWDAVNKKVIDYVAPLRAGDLAIVWNDDKTNAEIKEITRISTDPNDVYPYNYAYMNAIKCTSLEQYTEFKNENKEKFWFMHKGKAVCSYVLSIGKNGLYTMGRLPYEKTCVKMNRNNLFKTKEECNERQ